MIGNSPMVLKPNSEFTNSFAQIGSSTMQNSSSMTKINKLQVISSSKSENQFAVAPSKNAYLSRKIAA